MIHSMRIWPLILTLALAATPLTAADPTPTTFTEWVLKGYDYERQQNFSAAIEAYTQALKLNEESPTAYVRRAICAAKAGQLERAAMDLREATLLNPVSMTDYTTLAWLLATCPIKSVRDGTRAVAFAQKALKENESAETYDILAAAYAEMGNFQKAQNLLREAIKKFPESPRIPVMRERLELFKQKKPFREVWLGDKEQKTLQNRVDYPR
jgi:tetratricopeptide (TPR) repeat protein